MRRLAADPIRLRSLTALLVLALAAACQAPPPAAKTAASAPAPTASPAGAPAAAAASTAPAASAAPADASGGAWERLLAEGRKEGVVRLSLPAGVPGLGDVFAKEFEADT